MGSSREASEGALRPVRILSVPALPPVTVRFLGPYLGIHTHWVGKRYRPCLGVDHCDSKIHNALMIWKGFLPCDLWDLSTSSWIAHVLEISESFEHQLSGRELRGEVWVLSRKGQSAKGELLGFFSERMPEPTMGRPFEVSGIVERVYHVEGLQWGVKNPVPRPVMVPPRKDFPPRIAAEIAAPDPSEQQQDPKIMDELMKKLRAEMKSMGGRVNGKA